MPTGGVFNDTSLKGSQSKERTHKALPLLWLPDTTGCERLYAAAPGRGSQNPQHDLEVA